MYFWFVETDDGQQYLNINKHDRQTSRTKYDQTIKYIMKTLFDWFGKRLLHSSQSINATRPLS